MRLEVKKYLYDIEFIDDDELVEITPHHLRLRKRFLKETDRRRADRAAAG